MFDAMSAAREEEQIRLLMELRRQGVRDADVLAAIERCPREVFITRAFAGRAYDDRALPIECGQTISQPFVVAYMTEALRLDDRLKVLEVGTGSGYQAAVLSHLARRVYTVERYATLYRKARARFDALGLHNVTTRHGDGTRGWPEQAPFDRILVTAAAEDPPAPLIDQLKPGGVMVLPVAESEDMQQLIRITKTDAGLEYDELIPVRFVPLVENVAPEEEED